jgi:Uma2 family endonuclease
MATTTHISLSEYLRTSFRPDREYVDGELRERNVGLWSHARTTALLAGWIGAHESEWGVIAGLSPRVQVSENRVRVPDLAVVLPGPQSDVLVNSPLLVVEIVSPDDSYSDTQERAQDYRDMGVETVWIIDPKTRTGRMCTGASWVEAKRLAVAGTPLHVELDQIFSQI